MTRAAIDARPESRAALGVVILASAALGLTAVTIQPQTAANPEHAVDAVLRINPNFAGAAELALLPRIGPVMAERIIAFRESSPRVPAFDRPEDLNAVERIGPRTVELLRPHLQFNSPH